MDPAVTVVVSAAVGGVVTALGGWWRQRSTARTAARLVYAELTRNSAPALYYCQMGVWPDNPVADAAWTESGKDLARPGNPHAFDAIHRGYLALPALAYAVTDADIDGEDRAALINSALIELAEAVETAGDVAGIASRNVEQYVTPLRRGASVAIVGKTAHTAGMVPPSALYQMAVRGTPLQQSSARTTIELSPQVGPAPATESRRPGRSDRIIRSAGGREDLAHAEVVRREGEPSAGDPAVDEAYDAIGTTVQFYRDVLGRDSVSGDGGPITAVVHFGDAFCNAFWDGGQLVFGDGDGDIFNRFTVALDVVAHELSHAVPEWSELTHAGQSGALVESLCDVFGILTKQHHLGQNSAPDADWIIGEGLLLEGGGIRSMASPGTAYDNHVMGRDPQPAHMRDFVKSEPGPAGPIVNCGIPNRAFYLAAAALPGPAWETAGQIWYQAATSGRLRPRTSFATFAGLTIATAKRVSGADSSVVEAIDEAWRSVGVTPRSPAHPRQSEIGAADPGSGG